MRRPPQFPVEDKLRIVRVLSGEMTSPRRSGGTRPGSRRSAVGSGSFLEAGRAGLAAGGRQVSHSRERALLRSPGNLQWPK